MKKAFFTLVTITLLGAGCNQNADNISDGYKNPARIYLCSNLFSTRIVDADNLAVEQNIVNLSIFLTEPSSNTITNSYIYPGFSTSGDYRIVTLPDDPADLGEKDIYVVANFDNSATLETITTITELEQLWTPIVNKTNNLDPARGICMYGSTADFDFTSGETALVTVERTCAKFRINLTFPGAADLSTDNSYLVATAASHTFIGKNSTLVLPLSDYFNFASAIDLEPTGSGGYEGIFYVYEAFEAPTLYIYTHINGTAVQQEFSEKLHIPVRNYLYDLRVYIYEDITTRSDESQNHKLGYTADVYDAAGKLVETIVR